MLLEYQRKKKNWGYNLRHTHYPEPQGVALTRQRGQVKRLTKEPARLEYTRFTNDLEGRQIRGKGSGLRARAAAPVAP